MQDGVINPDKINPGKRLNRSQINAPPKHRTLSAMITDQLRQAILTVPSRPAAVASGRAGRGLWREPDPGAGGAVSARGRGTGEDRPAKGAIVSELSLDEINDVFDLRAFSNRGCSRNPRPAAPPFLALDDIHALREGDPPRDISEWGQINADFHMGLYVHARLPRTQTIVLALLQTCDRYTRVQLSTPKAMGPPRKNMRNSSALPRGEGRGGLPFLERHIEAVRKDLVKVVAGSTIAPKSRRKDKS